MLDWPRERPSSYFFPEKRCVHRTNTYQYNLGRKLKGKFKIDKVGKKTRLGTREGFPRNGTETACCWCSCTFHFSLLGETLFWPLKVINKKIYFTIGRKFEIFYWEILISIRISILRSQNKCYLPPIRRNFFKISNQNIDFSIFSAITDLFTCKQLHPMLLQDMGSKIITLLWPKNYENINL